MEKFILDEIRDNYSAIVEKVNEAAIKSGRSEQDVRLMCVTKTHTPDVINPVLDMGANLIGENRVQEYLGKCDELHLDGVEKHLIGHLQTNKVRQIVGKVDMIQSVDSFKLAKEISKVSLKNDLTTKVLVEVNIGEEESKSGIALEELGELIGQIATLEGIQVEGLMTVPPICDDDKILRQYFAKMHQTFVDFKGKTKDNIHMNVLSMGMSNDFENAILEGSTLVRVGSAIFGTRHYD